MALIWDGRYHGEISAFAGMTVVETVTGDEGESLLYRRALETLFGFGGLMGCSLPGCNGP